MLLLLHETPLACSTPKHAVHPLTSSLSAAMQYLSDKVSRFPRRRPSSMEARAQGCMELRTQSVCTCNRMQRDARIKKPHSLLQARPEWATQYLDYNKVPFAARTLVRPVILLRVQQLLASLATLIA